MALRSVFGNRETREKKTLPNRDYYRTLIENKKEATFLIDYEGDIFLINKKAQSLTGFTEDEIREYHVRDIFATVRTVDNPLDTRQFTEFSSKLFLIDSRKYLIPINLEFKEIEGQKFLCICSEADDNETRTQDIKQTSVPEPLPVISQPPKNEIPPRWPVDFEHKVRNLLGSILGFSSILSDDPMILSDKKLSRSVESIQKSGNQLKKLFNQGSLNEHDAHEVNRTSCQLAPILQKAGILLEPVARSHSQVINIRPVPEMVVFTDEFLLMELLKFLIGKALIYSRNDEVTIEVSVDSATRKAVVSIDNLGQDIPQGVINFIKRENSKDFYDVASPIIAQNQEIIDLLQTLNKIEGKITFSTTATLLGEIALVSLPLASAGEEVNDVAALENSLRNKRLKVLVIEDEKLSATIIQLFINKLVEVSLAYSGNEALNIIEIFYNKGIIFNAVVSDIGLPSPWDGILLKQEIEKRWPEYRNIPFLAQTAFTAKSYSDRIAECNFKTHLIKPINRNDLLIFLDKYCR